MSTKIAFVDISFLCFVENLEMAPEPKVITHPEVGKYFQEFCGTHYLPNQEKAQQYPNDIEATRQYVRDKYNA